MPVHLCPVCPPSDPVFRFHRALRSDVTSGLTYAQAGVSVDAGNALVEAIKPYVRATRRAGADGEIGGFGGVFDLKATGYKDPVLVSGTDGVGTKLRVAVDAGIHDSVGSYPVPQMLHHFQCWIPGVCIFTVRRLCFGDESCISIQESTSWPCQSTISSFKALSHCISWITTAAASSRSMSPHK